MLLARGLLQWMYRDMKLHQRILHLVHNTAIAQALSNECGSVWKRGRNKMTTKEAASVRYLCASLTLLALAHGAVGQAPPLPTELSSEEVIARVAPSVAVVLTGAGAGPLGGVSSRGI